VRTSITGVDDTRSFRALSRITQALVATVGTYSLTATGTPPVFFFKSAFRRAGRDDRVCAGVMVAASRRAVRGAANLDGRSIACSTRAGAPDGSRSTPPHHSTLLLHDAEARAECWRRRDPTRPCSTRRAPTVAMTRSRIAALHPRPGAAVVRPGFRGAARPSQTCSDRASTVPRPVQRFLQSLAVCRPFVIAVGEPTPDDNNYAAFHPSTPGVLLACRSTMPSITALLQWTTECRACGSALESRHHVVLHVRITERWCPRCETCDVWWGGSPPSKIAPPRATTPVTSTRSPAYTP
jgi:hypothetical protein